MVKRVTGHVGVQLTVDPGPAFAHLRDWPAEQRLGAGAQMVVGVLVNVEGERLGVFVRVADGEPAVEPLDQQQLGAGPAGRGSLRRQLGPARQV